MQMREEAQTQCIGMDLNHRACYRTGLQPAAFDRSATDTYKTTLPQSPHLRKPFIFQITPPHEQSSSPAAVAACRRLLRYACFSGAGLSLGLKKLSFDLLSDCDNVGNGFLLLKIGGLQCC